jgi:hypothetical protein
MPCGSLIATRIGEMSSTRILIRVNSRPFVGNCILARKVGEVAA